MILPTFAVLEAFPMPLTTGIVRPLPSETTTIPSEFETLYEDIQGLYISFIYHALESGAHKKSSAIAMLFKLYELSFLRLDYFVHESRVSAFCFNLREVAQ